METATTTETFRRRMRKMLERLDERLIANLPEPVRAVVRRRMNELREVIMDARAPRFAILGRRGAGKSSLINAVFGAKVAEVGPLKSTTGVGRWYEYQGPRGTMSVLDTRGLGEGSAPVAEAREPSPKGEVKAALREKCPDVLLFLCKAKEVDSRIDPDLDDLADIKGYVEKTHSYDPPVVGVITQVDELDPAELADPPYDDEVKQRNISGATAALWEKAKARLGDVIEVIPTSAYIHFSNGQIACDRRWNIERLVDYLAVHLPGEAQMIWARMARVRSAQKRVARVVTGAAAALAGAVGAAEPIPVADLPIITGIQVSMIVAIGYVSGREVDKRAAVAFMTAMGLNVGLAFGFRELARALLKLIPGPGNMISGAVAAAATWGIGEAAIAFFIDEKSPDEAKRVYGEQMNRRQEGR